MAPRIDANALFYGIFDQADQARQQRGENIAGPYFNRCDISPTRLPVYDQVRFGSVSASDPLASGTDKHYLW